MLFRRLNIFCVGAQLATLAALSFAPRAGAFETAPTIDFTRDVRPILAGNCFHCHGPDEGERQGVLRLDLWEGSGELRGAEAVVVVGKPDESELVARITSDDPDVRMPPSDSGKSLTPQQIEMLRNWVAEGAAYKQHWAFVPPQR